MKSGAVLWAGAICAALLAAVGLHRLSRQQPGPHAQSLAPIATPPGITVQVLAQSADAQAAADVVYADARGMTLYVYAKDTQRGKSACTVDCAKTWPPAVAPPGATALADWSVIAREDGSKQWAYRGAPLYRFANDEAIGDTKGDGADSGAWHVAAFRPAAGMALPDAIAVRAVPDAGGEALVDWLGMTLYAFDGDATHPRPSCDAGGDCARRWVPLEAPAIANPTRDFSVIARDDGIVQWAYRGRPLYKFDGDEKPSDAKGVGVDRRFSVALIVRYFMPADARIRRADALGAILATARGATLYQRDRATPDESHHFRADHGAPALGRLFGTATCDDNCAKTWRPYSAPVGALASGYWDVDTRPDGTKQWAYRGFALYTYAVDKPGDMSGNEIYDLAPVGDDGAVVDTGGHAPLATVTGAGVDPIVPPGGDVSGVGVGAMFWHAVVP